MWEEKDFFFDGAGTSRREIFGLLGAWYRERNKTKRQNEKVENKKSRENCVFTTFLSLPVWRVFSRYRPGTRNISKESFLGLQRHKAIWALHNDLLGAFFHIDKWFLSRLVGSLFERPIHFGAVVSFKHDVVVGSGVRVIFPEMEKIFGKYNRSSLI